MECKVDLNDILTEKQVFSILHQHNIECEIQGYKVSPACEGLSGFMGDHYKITLFVKNGKSSKEIKLFVKRVPKLNKPKASFIDEYKFFLRESLMFKLIEETRGAEGDSPWSVKAYIHNDDIMVMPDLTESGYSLRPLYDYLDLDHVLIVVRSLARFHAAIASNFTHKSLTGDQNKTLMEEIRHAREEPIFRDSPWLKAAAKLSACLLKEFSTKPIKNSINMEKQVLKVFLEACSELRERPDTLNVLMHKDMWVNNIMFKYDNDVPTNAVLIDYQCIRYAPPAFDLMSFLYLTTSRTFREEHETLITNYYFSVFNDHVDKATEQRLIKFDYNLESFKGLCEFARKFGMVHVMGIFPYVLMEPNTAKATFDDPITYNKYLEDRCEPVIEHARQSPCYRKRQLEVTEEFVERYIE